MYNRKKLSILYELEFFVYNTDMHNNSLFTNIGHPEGYT